LSLVYLQKNQLEVLLEQVITNVLYNNLHRYSGSHLTLRKHILFNRIILSELFRIMSGCFLSKRLGFLEQDVLKARCHSLRYPSNKSYQWPNTN